MWTLWCEHRLYLQVFGTISLDSSVWDGYWFAVAFWTGLKVLLGLGGDTEFVWTVTAAVGVKTGTFDEGGSKALAVDSPSTKTLGCPGTDGVDGVEGETDAEFWVKSESIIGSCPMRLRSRWVGGSYSKILSTKTHLRPAVQRARLSKQARMGKMQIFSERMQLLTRSRSRHTQHAATGKGTHPLSEPSLPPAMSSSTSSGVSFVAASDKASEGASWDASPAEMSSAASDFISAPGWVAQKQLRRTPLMLRQACCLGKSSFHYQITSEGEGTRHDAQPTNLVTKEEDFRGSDFCRPGSFSQSRKKNTGSKSINKAYAPEAARGWIPPQRALHSPGGRAGAPGLQFMLCRKWINHPKAAAGACPIKAPTLGKTWAKNRTQAWVDRSEDYTHPCFHPSSFSLSLSITPTHTFCLLLCLLSPSSHTVNTKHRVGQVCAWSN